MRFVAILTRVSHFDLTLFNVRGSTVQVQQLYIICIFLLGLRFLIVDFCLTLVSVSLCNFHIVTPRLKYDRNVVANHIKLQLSLCFRIIKYYRSPLVESCVCLYHSRIQLYLLDMTSNEVRSAEEFSSFLSLPPQVEFFCLAYKGYQQTEEQLIFFQPTQYAISKFLPFSIIIQESTLSIL